MPIWSADSKQLRSVALLSCLLLLTPWFAACGGGGGNDDSVDMNEAFQVLGQASFTAGSPNGGGAASAATLAQPLGNIATDGTVMFVADTSNNRVLAYTQLPTTNGAPAQFVLGQPSPNSTTGATARDRMALPSSVFLGGGKLVVADSGNNRVLIWNTIPTAASSQPDVVVGQTDFTTSTSGVSATQLAFPSAAIIANGRLLIADQNNNRVLVWGSVPTANGAAATQVLGQPNFTSRLADDEAEEMNRPASLWSDGFRLLVADAGNNRVLFWSLFPQDSGAEADYVIGQSGFSRSTAGTAATSLRTPFGVSADGTRIYVADSGNNRVLAYNSFPIANGSAASEVFGQEVDNFAAAVANDDDQDGEVDDTPSARTLSGPSGAFVYNGVLYVSDRNNNRVMMFPQ